MASDNFTNDDGTALETHNPEWTSVGGLYVVTNLEINSNIAEHEAAWQTSGCYYDASSEDDSEIVDKARDAGAKHVACRMDASELGYDCSIGFESGGNWVDCYIGRSGGYLDTLELGGGIWSQASDHTIRVTASGTTTVTIEGFVDDVSQGTIEDSSGSRLEGPGHPGFWTAEAGDVTDTRWDDWTDGVGESSSSSSSSQSISVSSSSSSESTSVSSSSSSESASESSSSSSESISVSSSSSSESLSGEGWTWGEQNPTPETAVEWSVWRVKESANDARDSGDWGLLQLGSGEEFVSDVRDRGNTDTQYLSLSYDDYAVGSGSGTLYWRGQAAIFNYDDDEVSGPTWELYAAGNKSWRYIQLMCEG